MAVGAGLRTITMRPFHLVHSVCHWTGCRCMVTRRPRLPPVRGWYAGLPEPVSTAIGVSRLLGTGRGGGPGRWWYPVALFPQCRFQPHAQPPLLRWRLTTCKLVAGLHATRFFPAAHIVVNQAGMPAHVATSAFFVPSRTSPLCHCAVPPNPCDITRIGVL